MSDSDSERNRIGGRVARYARVGTNMAGVAAGVAARRVMGGDRVNASDASAIARSLGQLKGPLMKVAQLLSTIPEAVPAEYAAELAQLQSDAPPMGWAFVKRRMRAELGADWQSRFSKFERTPAAAASLGQVHRATTPDGLEVACKLQYPDMASAVEADLSQLNALFALYRRMDGAIDPSEMKGEIAERVREELDYRREARHMALYRRIFDGDPLVRVPDVLSSHSTGRLLTMGWLEGRKLLDFKDAPLEQRNLLATAMFRAWWHPFARYGVIHGDPHLGNYTVRRDETGEPVGINLLDYGCIRIFPPRFVGGVIDLYQGLRTDDEDRLVHAYETWGFEGLNREIIDTLNIWARFIYGPLLEDRVRAIADGISPAEYGRREAFRVHQSLKRLGPIRIPREFVFMDRAAIGLGGVFLHLRAELNFFRLYNDEIDGFETAKLTERQTDALRQAGLNQGESQ